MKEKAWKIKTGEMILVTQDDMAHIRREAFLRAVRCLERALASGFSDGDEVAKMVSEKVTKLFRDEVKNTSN